MSKIDCGSLFSNMQHLKNFIFPFNLWYYSWTTVQFSRSVLSDSLWPHEPQHARSPPNSQSLPKLMSIESVMPSNHLILCDPLLLLPSIPPSIRVFSNESVLRIRWPKYWSFNFSISPSNEHPGLMSLRMDWLDLLAVQGSLKSLLQHRTTASYKICSKEPSENGKYGVLYSNE